MDIEEVKNELTKTAVEIDSDIENNHLEGWESAYAEGYCWGCEYALDLLEDSQEKKVVVPQFVADWIKTSKHMGKSLQRAISCGLSDKYGFPEVSEWMNCPTERDENVLRFAQAWLNGYEIEEEHKYRVKVDDKLYFQRFENIEAVFVIDDSLGVKESSPVFTREVGNKILETLGVESGQLEEAED